MSEENKNTTQSASTNKEKQANPFGNLHPAEIPTKLHTFSYNGKIEKRDKHND